MSGDTNVMVGAEMVRASFCWVTFMEVVDDIFSVGEVGC